MLGLAVLLLVAFGLIVLIGSIAILLGITRPRRKTFAVAVALGCPTEPADLGLEGEEALFSLPARGKAHDHTSPGWIIKGERPNAPAALILHGHRDSRYGALYRAQTLAPFVSHCVVFDWPAHGDCTAQWMTFGRREADDVAAVADGLPPELTANGLVLFGYSLGGQIAIKAAAEHPRFAGVIADGPYRHWDSPIRARLGTFGVPAGLFVPVLGLAFRAMGWLPGFDRARYAGKLDIPLLVLHGTDDAVCPHHEGQALADAAPHGELVSFPGGGHLHLPTHDKGKYEAAVAAFFEKVERASSV